MESIKVFNNPEFGEIRTTIIDVEPWFFAKDIAEKLEYTKTSNMLKLVDVEDKRCLSGSDLEPLGITYPKVSFINESGLYAAIFGSKQENAKKFKRWVTSEVLPAIRKTGGYNAPQTIPEQIQLLAQGNVELNKRVDDIQAEVETIKSDLPILPLEAYEIEKAVRRKGVEVLGGKKANAYNDRGLRQRLYNDLYANLKHNFDDIRTYKAIRRKDADKAIKIITEYRPPLFLAEQIENVNAQQTLDLKGGAAE